MKIIPKTSKKQSIIIFNIKQLNELFDSLIVLINISNSYSILPYLFFFQYYRAYNTVIITALNLAYLIYRFKDKIIIPNPRKHILFSLFILINVTNTIFGLITDTYGLGVIPFIFSNFTFYILLCNLYTLYIRKYQKHKSIDLVLRGYIWFCILNTISVILLFSLITFLNFDPIINEVNNTMDLFAGNVERSFGDYYFPKSISILFTTNDIRIPFFQQYGIICGLFHEPHTMTFVTTPAIFYLLFRTTKKYKRVLIIVLFVLTILIAASTTNILSLLICCFIYYLLKAKEKFIYPFVAICFLIITVIFLDESYYSFILDKLTSRSLDYSQSTISFAFLPKTVLGTNFYDLSYWDKSFHSNDVGLFNFVINLTFLVIIYLKTIKMNLSNSKEIKVLGLMVLYFLLHSAKVAMVSYSLSMLILMIFIIKIYSTMIQHK